MAGAHDEELYKRKEDQDWRKRVEERLNALTSSDNVQNDRLDEDEGDLLNLKHVVNGDPDERNDTGLKGDIQEMNAGINSLRAIMAPDQLGNGGVKNRLSILESRVKGMEESKESRWKFWTAVACALILLVREIVHDLPEIKAFIEPTGKHAVVRKGKKAKAAKKPKAAARDDDASDDDMPEVPGADGVSGR